MTKVIGNSQGKVYVANNKALTVNQTPIYATKYNTNINTYIGDIDSDGILQAPTEASDIVFTGVKTFAFAALAYKFYNSGINSVLFPDLEEVTTMNSLTFAFSKSTVKTASFPELTAINYASDMFSGSDLESISLPKLTTIIGGSSANGLYSAFSNTRITELDLPELTTLVNSACCAYMCSLCGYLETVKFTKLSVIPTNSYAYNCNFNYAFSNTPNLKNIYFNAVNSNTFTGGYTYVFSSMFSSNSGSNYGCTVHFPSNMQTIISQLDGYPTFGGSSSYITLAFDLPATS